MCLLDMARARTSVPTITFIPLNYPLPPQHQWSASSKMTSMPPHLCGRLSSLFNSTRLLQLRQHLQCQIRHPLSQNSRRSSAKNQQNESFCIQENMLHCEAHRLHFARIHGDRHQHQTHQLGLTRHLPICLERAILHP